MATKNQKIVATALAIARAQGRKAGLSHLTNMMPGKFTNPVLAEAWFNAKCDEHKIP